MSLRAYPPSQPSAAAACLYTPLAVPHSTRGVEDGAVVAGVQPFGDASAEDLLWPGATLDFDRIDLSHNLAALSEAVADWSPAIARRNHRRALRQLDWRWRIKTLAERLDLENPELASELARLDRAIGTAPA